MLLCILIHFFQCVHVSGLGFHRGGYQCICRPEFYPPSHTSTSSTPNRTPHFNGSDVERAYIKKLLNHSDLYHDNMFSCLPCAEGCLNCTDPTPCNAEYDVMMRGIPLGIQSFCMTISVVLALVILRLRRTKVREMILPEKTGRAFTPVEERVTHYSVIEDSNMIHISVWFWPSIHVFNILHILKRSLQDL